MLSSVSPYFLHTQILLVPLNLVQVGSKTIQYLNIFLHVCSRKRIFISYTYHILSLWKTILRQGLYRSFLNATSPLNSINQKSNFLIKTGLMARMFFTSSNTQNFYLIQKIFLSKFFIYFLFLKVNTFCL